MNTRFFRLVSCLGLSCGHPETFGEPRHLSPLGELRLVDGQAQADLAMVGQTVTFTEAGAELTRGAEPGLSIRLVDWGRATRVSVEPVMPAITACSRQVRSLVPCADKLSYDRDGLLEEWWLPLSTGLEHGWTIHGRPAGDGELTFRVSLGHSVELLAGGDRARVQEGPGQTWSIHSVRAIDAHGAPVPARLQTVEGDLVVALDDTSAQYPITVDPIYETATSHLSGGGTLQFGNQMAHGDFNADGYDDIAIHTNEAYNSVYIYPGSSTGLAEIPTHRIATLPSDHQIADIRPAGDVNGDGYEDLLVGRYTNGTGQVHIHFGSASGLEETASVEIDPPAAATYGFGTNIVGELDVDGDGIDDLIALSAAYYSTNYVSVNIVYGSTSSIDSTATSLGTVSGSTLTLSRTPNRLFAAGDLQGDGYVDLALDDTIIYADATGLDLSTQVTLPSGEVSRRGGDFNNDGYDDLVALIGRWTMAIYLGDASGLGSTPDATISLPYVGWDNIHFISPVGDYNGDGYDDLLVGQANQYAYLYEGSSTGLGTTYAQSFSASTYNGFGQVIEGGMDIDGDGFPDAVIADLAVFYNAGGVYTYYSDGATGFTQDALIQSFGDGRGFGSTVALVGDFDGDGHGDAAIEAEYGTASGGSASGAMFMYVGTPTGLDWAPINRVGASPSIAGLGDIDNDGYDDFVVGRASSGVAYIYMGSGTAAPQAWNYVAETTTDFGQSVAGPGDIDGDGYDDLLVTGAGIGGYAYVYQGVSTGINSTALATLSVSTTTGTRDAASGIGDVNGDGYPDMAVGIPGASSSSGLAYTFLGAATGPAALPSTILACPDAGACEFGVSLDGGDIDGDGFSDLVVGAPNTWTGAGQDGAVFVFYGTATGVSTSPAYTLYGNSSAGDFGEAVRLGDLSGSGYADIAIGDPSASDAAVSIFAGSSSGISTTPDVSLAVADLYASAGLHLDIGPDVDGDGQDDLLVGADGGAMLYRGWTDADEDGVGAAEDCDDTDASVGGPEVQAYPDDDGDGFGDPLDGSLVCALSSGWLEDDSDCDDTDATVFPGATEQTGDGIDSDCDGTEICYLDGDGDGYRPDATSTVASTDTDCGDTGEATASAPTGDCDDTDATASPVGVEVPDDRIDQDCSGTDTCLVDTDGDGYVPDTTTLVDTADDDCTDTGEGEATDPAGDCDDTDSTVNPGATEGTGDGVDQDCDGTEVCFTDLDGDGFRPDSGATVTSSDADCTDTGEAASTIAIGDCDDTDATRSPGATEGVGDGIDQDCDGMELCFADLDVDGYVAADGATVGSSDTDCTDPLEGSTSTPGGDCDDDNGTIHPGATERAGDGVDQDCNNSELCYDDLDADGYRTGAETDTHPSSSLVCAEPSEGPASMPTGDCDDTDATRHPGATEGVGDEVDQDCDDTELCFPDADADGYADFTGAAVPSTDTDCDDSGEAASTDPGDDCDDTDDTVHPAAAEVPGDERDQDCDGAETCFVDLDGDGYRPDTDETIPSEDLDCADEGEAAATVPAGDCADGDAAIYPGAADIPGDLIDQDCSGADAASDPATADDTDAPADTDAAPDKGTGCHTASTSGPLGVGWGLCLAIVGMFTRRTWKTPRSPSL